MIWMMRQPSGERGTTKYPSRAANTKPKEKKPERLPTNRPRYFRWMNSARNGAMIALSAPVPKLAITRQAKRNCQLWAKAATSVPTQ